MSPLGASASAIHHTYTSWCTPFIHLVVVLHSTSPPILSQLRLVPCPLPLVTLVRFVCCIAWCLGLSYGLLLCVVLPLVTSLPPVCIHPSTLIHHSARPCLLLLLLPHPSHVPSSFPGCGPEEGGRSTKNWLVFCVVQCVPKVVQILRLHRFNLVPTYTVRPAGANLRLLKGWKFLF